MNIYRTTVRIASSPLSGGSLFVKNTEIKTFKVINSSIKRGIVNSFVFFGVKDEDNSDLGCLYDVGLSSTVTEHPFNEHSVLEIRVDSMFLSKINKDKLERACLDYIKSHYPELMKIIGFS